MAEATKTVPPIGFQLLLAGLHNLDCRAWAPFLHPGSIYRATIGIEGLELRQRTRTAQDDEGFIRSVAFSALASKCREPPY